MKTGMRALSTGFAALALSGCLLASLSINVARAQGTTQNSYMLNPQRGTALGTGVTYDGSAYEKGGPAAPTTAAPRPNPFDQNPSTQNGGMGSNALGVGNNPSNLNSLGNSSLGVGNTNNSNGLGNSRLGGVTPPCTRTTLTGSC